MIPELLLDSGCASLRGMQVPYSPDITESLASLLADLLDARWVITTIVAIYAAVLSTFQVFIKDWWQRRPRLRVRLNKMVQVGNGETVDLLSTNVINFGYHAVRMHQSVSFEIRETRANVLVRTWDRVRRKGERHTHFFVTRPQFAPAPPGRLEPTDSYQVMFGRDLAFDAAKNQELTKTTVGGAFHVRTLVQDGTNRMRKSNWVRLDCDEK